jgi:hypothetical protein
VYAIRERIWFFISSILLTSRPEKHPPLSLLSPGILGALLTKVVRKWNRVFTPGTLKAHPIKGATGKTNSYFRNGFDWN